MRSIYLSYCMRVIGAVALGAVLGGILALNSLSSFSNVQQEQLQNRQESKKGALLVSETRVIPQGGEESTKAPPWSMPPVDVHSDAFEFFRNQTTRYVIGNFSFSYGMGNLMFQYASLLALAQHHGARLVVPQSMLLRRAFHLSRPIFVTDEVAAQLVFRWPKYTFVDCCRFYNDTMDIEVHHTHIKGYFQSFKYFHPSYSADIVNEFAFLPEVKRRAQNVLKDALLETGKRRTLVAIHVRRGMDVTMNLRNVNHGHKIANRRFYKHAMSHFRDRYPDVLFIVCSDNAVWASENLKGTDVFVVKNTEREVDMCLMSMCDHVIVSIGTFGWWAAYLSTGNDAVYYKNWPMRGSKLDSMLAKEDFFLPNWIGMD